MLIRLSRKFLKGEKSSLNTTLVSTTNIVTENNVLGSRGNWGVLNGYHGDKGENPDKGLFAV